MLKDRSELENYLVKWIINNTSNRQQRSIQQQWCVELLEKYNIPIVMSSDILSQRKDLSEYNKFVLFAVTDIVKPDKVEEFYTSQEIKLYTGKKYEPQKVTFPFKLHLIKITDDQYIGKTTAQFLMGLREMQIINYNADTQRALRIMLKGGTKILRPFINDKTVMEIDNSFAENTFIPNMLTLNINLDDEEADYVYDDKEEILKISNLTAFDIVDGYHRYLGLSRNYDRDNTWDYPMMLQITTFSVGKAKQFIFQENHKTVRKEIDSSTYDQYNPGNMVVNRLNNDPECNLNGNIGLSGGIVNAGVLGQVINRIYFPKKPDRKEIISTTKEIKTALNTFTEEQDEYLERSWDAYEIIMIIYGLFNKYDSDRIYNAIKNISQDNIDTLNRIKDANNKVLNILKEVY